MNVKKIVNQLKKKYPGKKIVFNPQNHPAEIICEIDPTTDHPEKGTALAIVGRSKPHYHTKITEVYEVLKGILVVYKNGKKFILKEKDRITIEPMTIHHVEGKETWFLTFATPGWTPKDHMLIK